MIWYNVSLSEFWRVRLVTDAPESHWRNSNAKSNSEKESQICMYYWEEDVDWFDANIPLYFKSE